MKNKNLLRYVSSFVFAIFALVLSGCSEDPTPVVWDDYKDKNDVAPIITSIESERGIYSVIDTLIINGSNFSSVPGDMAVFFNGREMGVVLSSTENQILVRTPSLTGHLEVHVTKRTAEQHDTSSTDVEIGLGTYFTFGAKTHAKTFVSDASGRLYASVVTFNADSTEQRYGLFELERSNGTVRLGNMYMPTGGGPEVFWYSMRFLGSQMYATKNLRGIWQINQGVAPTLGPVIGPTQGIDKNITDFDFFSQSGLGVAVGEENVYTINIAAKTAKKFVYKIKATSCRTFGNKVYVSGKVDSTNGVWSFDINGDNPVSNPVNILTVGKDINVTSLEIDNNGRIYVSTENSVAPKVIPANPNPIYVITNGLVETFYPGLLNGAINRLAWLPGTNYLIYVTKYISSINQLMVYSPSAPNFSF